MSILGGIGRLFKTGNPTFNPGAYLSGKRKISFGPDFAPSYGETQADWTTGQSRQQLADLRDFLAGGRGSPDVTGLVGEGAEENLMEREGALEGGLRGGQLSKFLAEQPFRRRQKQSTLLSRLLGETTARTGALAHGAGSLTLGRNQLNLQKLLGEKQMAFDIASVHHEQALAKKAAKANLLGTIGNLGGALIGGAIGAPTGGGGEMDLMSHLGGQMGGGLMSLFRRLMSGGRNTTRSDAPYPNFLGGFQGGQFNF